MNFSDSALGALYSTLWQGALLFAFPLFISLLIYTSERLVTGWFIRTTGYKGIWLTAWLGTPVHESAHALMCFLFRCPIKEIRFFIPDPESQVLGYVKYTHNPRNPFHWVGRWFIGLAPLLAGSAVLLGLLMLSGFLPFSWRPDLLPGQSNDWLTVLGLHIQTLSSISMEMAGLLFSGSFWQNPVNWLILYVSLAVVTHMAPSFADLKGTVAGWIFMFVLVFFVNFIVVYFSVPFSYDGLLYFVSLLLTRLLALALILSLVNLVFWFFVLNVIHRLKTGFWLMGRQHKG